MITQQKHLQNRTIFKKNQLLFENSCKKVKTRILIETIS